METKKCQYCNSEIIGKREDAKFCSNTCKAKHWEGKKIVFPPAEAKNVTHQLRGVINENEKANPKTEVAKPPEPVYEIVEVLEANLSWLTIVMEKKRLTDVRKALNIEVQSLQTKMEQTNSSNGNGWVTTLTGTGAIIGNHSTEKKVQGTLLGATFGAIVGAMLQGATENSREENKKIESEKIKIEIQNKLKQIQDTDKELTITEDKLKVTPRYKKVQQRMLVTTQKTKEADNSTSVIATKTEITKPLSGLQKDVYNVPLTNVNSNKIISSEQLNKMQYVALNFQGKWYLFFGSPSFNFHLAIHGMSGEGKSTVSIQFAKYLADNIGRVIYISGEEGFSKTFKDKFSNNNAESKFLDVADLRTFDDIIREIPTETYNFIFIDSLDNMKIDADKMKKIRERYKNSALITISQSTKDGKMRGSYEIVHDSDITVKVENGIAATTKNRFKEKGMYYAVFQK